MGRFPQTHASGDETGGDVVNRENRVRRAKMARRHPKSRKVRSRPQIRRQKIDWVKWTAIITAVVSLSGLVFGGVGSYWGARTSKDQLAQSREEEAQARRKQASLVTSWVEQRPEGLVRIVVNRSPDPVFSVQLDYEWNDPKDAEAERSALQDHRGDTLSDIAEGSRGGWDRLLRGHEDVMADQELIFPDGTRAKVAKKKGLLEVYLEIMIRNARARYIGEIPPCTRVELKPPVRNVDLRFIDSRGKHWLRTSQGILRPSEPEPLSDASMTLAYSRDGILQAAPPKSKLTKIDCGESEKP